MTLWGGSPSAEQLWLAHKRVDWHRGSARVGACDGTEAIRMHALCWNLTRVIAWVCVRCCRRRLPRKSDCQPNNGSVDDIEDRVFGL
jgi:hypothetical protein